MIIILPWTSPGNKPLKMPSDSISEGLIFKIFWSMPPDPLNLVLFNQINYTLLFCNMLAVLESVVEVTYH